MAQEVFQRPVEASSSDSNNVRWSYEENGTVKVDLPARYRHILDNVGEDHQAVLIAWDLENVQGTVDNINKLPPGPQGFLGLFHLPITVTDLQRAIIDHVAKYTGGDNIGNCVIAPNTENEGMILHGRLCELGLYEYPRWLHERNMLHLPLGRIFVLADSTKRTTGTPNPGYALHSGIALMQ